MMTTLLNGMDTWAAAWWNWMFHSSWQVALLVLCIWGITRVTRRRGAASFRCALWLLVFIKLLLPPEITAPWSVGGAAERIAEVGGYSISTGSVPTFPATNVPAIQMSPTLTTAETGASVSNRLGFPGVAFLLWLTIALTLFLAILFQYFRYYNRIYRSSDAAPAWLEDLAATRAEAVGLRRLPKIRIASQDGVPAVFGLFRPLILIPRHWLDSFDRESVANVLTHELAHVRRGDLAVGWFTACLTCCYWFHPLVWVAHRQLRREREMACDDWVLRSTTTDGTEYAGTILKGAEHARGEVPAGAGFLGLMELSEDLLYRIRSAGDARRKRQMGLRSALTLALVVMGLFPMQAATRAAEAPLNFDPSTPATQEEELARYEKAHPEVQAFIKHTMESFGRSNLWLDATALNELTAAEREDRIPFIAEVLEGEYGRHQCEHLAVAGVLRDTRLVPGLQKVAAYHRDDRDYDCRPKWMAVAALGRQGDMSAIPTLIPLVDHGNLNTRLWARGSLVRLTGQNFQDDKKAWGAWWNAFNREPTLTDEDLAPWKMPGTVAEATAASTPPEIVSISPAIGASNVSPELSVITITFDQDMGGGFSWTGGGDRFPETVGRPKWQDKRTCILPVKLESGNTYRVGLNSNHHINFQSAMGVPLEPVVWEFTAH